MEKMSYTAAKLLLEACGARNVRTTRGRRQLVYATYYGARKTVSMDVNEEVLFKELEEHMADLRPRFY